MMNRIKKYEGFVNESAYVDEFQILYDKAPDNLKDEINATRLIEQSEKWHPEGNVYIHTRLVTNRLYNKYHDPNLTLAGLFHDLGKVRTTEYDEEKESWTAHGHEDDSAKLAKSYKEWIAEMGGDYKIIKYIIKNHMRIKYLDEFRLQQKVKFLNDPLFHWVHKFTTADYGGSDLDCEPLMDLSKLEHEVSEFNKREKENKIISSKFNGRMLMDIYPDLKGKKLGDAITGFKQFVEEDYGDYKQYILDNETESILDYFNDFYTDWFVK